jgi:hypothetical protein
MSDWAAFRISLSAHPGPPIALLLTIWGAIAGIGRGEWMPLWGALIMSVFWLPVVLTAWSGRKIYRSQPPQGPLI